MMTRTAIAVFAAAVAGPSGWAQVEPLDEAFEYEGNRPALGAWLGNVTLPGRDAAPAQVVIDREGDGPWSIAATLPPWRAVAEPCVDVTVHDRSVTFTLKARHQAATFRGTVSGDGQRLAGTVSVAGDGPGGVFELARTPRPDDLPEPMAFTGGLPSPTGRELPITVVLAETPGGNWVGHLDFPVGGIEKYPIINIAKDGDTLTLHVPVSRPLLMRAAFDADRQRLTGTFQQGGLTFDLDLARLPVPARADAAPPALPEWAAGSWMVRRNAEAAWALTGGNVIDVRTGVVHENTTIVIRGDLIESVSPDGPPPGMHTVDISGRYVIPGLFDLHAHIQPFPSQSSDVSDDTETVMRTLLDHGVTTVRALPLLSEFALAVGARVNDGSLAGPTVIPSSGIFEMEPQRTSWGFWDPETARRWVSKEALLGSRWIKVYNAMDAESLAAITDAAHRRGMRVCGHTEGVQPREASELGIDSIEHIVSIPLSCLRDGAVPPPRTSLPRLIGWRWRHVDPHKAAELLELLRANQTAWVPTLVVVEEMIERGDHDGGTDIDAETGLLLQEAIEASGRLAVELHRAGGLVGLGTDFPVDGVPAGESAHRELEMLVEKGGATPLEALQLGTVGSAAILGLDDIVGTIEARSLANLVVLAANPLEDISNTRSVVLVVVDGRLHEPG